MGAPKSKLFYDPERPQPDNYHARMGHALHLYQSLIYNQLLATQSYAGDYSMKINKKKTRLILFNPSKTLDFKPELKLCENEIQLVEEIKMVGPDNKVRP